MDTKAWDKIFKSQGKVFTEIHEDMPKIAGLLRGMKSKHILDLGCGTGRHTIYLAKQGFAVAGLDNSESGLEQTKAWLKNEGLTAELINQEMTKPLPFPSSSLDCVITIQAVHHAKLVAIKATINEIERVLKPGGLFYISVPKHKNQGKNFQEIEPNTFIPLDGQEKGLPHHYFNEESLRDLLADFEITDLHLDKGEHFCVTCLALSN